MARILIVEDERDIAQALVSLLEAEGYTAVHAPDGDMAWKSLQAEPLPELLLLDLVMPQMDGREFRRRQLADPRLSIVPVIVLTANDRVRDAETLRACAILRKPVDFPALLRAIQACLPARAAAT